MYASLPMYDWPEVRGEVDRLWQRTALHLRTAGLDVPDRLDRQGDIQKGWQRADLLLSQTCGLPYVRHLRGRVALVGAVDHGLSGIAPGMYCSRIVVRRGEVAGLAAFRGRRVAFSETDSQSGAGALRHLVRPLLRDGRFFGETLATGAHAASIRAVAQGRADLAAIDAASWELALRHMPEAQDLAVIASTDPTPGLPLITRLGGPVVALQQALAAALAETPAADRQAMMLQAILPRQDADFDILALWDAQSAGYAEIS